MSAVPLPRRHRGVPSVRDARHLRAVDEPVTRHTLAYALLLVALSAGVVFGAVALNALAAATAVEARELDAEVLEGERLHAQLVADVAALEDPARVREAALELGLVPSGPMRFVALERNLPADGAVARPVPDGPADLLKPVLSVER